MVSFTEAQNPVAPPDIRGWRYTERALINMGEDWGPWVIHKGQHIWRERHLH